MADSSLLVSIHDVSPLTYEDAVRAIALANEAGVPRRALTLLVVPEHEGRVSLGTSPDFVAWLKSLARDGATLVAHGLRHRMRGWVASPGRALWAYGFAAGQGEFYNATAAQSARWLERVVVTFREMGLGQALGGFVPPAWLLSAAARAEVAKAPFLYIETLRGLEVGGQRFARRLIGWGTRSPFEAWVTSAYAELVVRRAPADVRLAIHPGDMSSPICVASIRRCIERLTRVSSARSYAEYLALKRRSLSQPARAL